MNSIFRENNLIYLLLFLSIISGFVIIEDYGIGIEEHLHEQRTIIQRIKANLLSENSMLGRMSRKINTMTRRQALMRCLWCVVILMLLAVIGIVIYLKVTCIIY